MPDPTTRAVQREKLDKLADDIATRLELDDDTAERAVQIDYRAGQLCLRADLIERLLAPAERFPGTPNCACSRFCGDVAEADDDPNARCKGLPAQVD